ncbi:dihydrolipoyl dehydrogenase [Promethearchaeum syntrophicum]|uniref:Dihydrolipoyl dehydrogenase n=1 Tax=Promethearchaeum syntrophicum TaxID=2594042 RepID=A0A5B9D7R0_9ARCH|nr:dihydrolipoyl dehydrogenase [Candidatus Prometheoarchaeum syntrophicum]
MLEYDLIVVGSGVGLTVLSQGLQMGLKCAVIEDAKMGGTCLTRGCIPSKVLVYPADVIREAEQAKKIGLDIKIEKINWELISERMWSQIDESKSIENSLSHAQNLTIYQGVGEFVGDYEMKVRLNKNGEYSEKFRGKKIVLASGGRSFIPPIEGLDEVGYITSETFFGLKFPKKPWESLIIIGGGVIAAEFAHIFSAMGTKVTIVEMLPHLVSTEEPEISEILEHKFSEYMQVLLNLKASKVETKNGKKVVELVDLKSNKVSQISAEEILIATGRRSNADILKVEKSGIQTDKRGWILTNEYLETNISNIWAIGDANGKYQFRHKANYDAEICTRNIFGHGKKSAVDYSSVPWAIFTYPQIAHVGMTQKESLKKGYHIYSAVKTYSTIAKGFAMGLEADDALFKLIVDQDYRILGAHAIGPHAATLIQQIVYLMNAGYTCPHDEEVDISKTLPKAANSCPEAGSFMPIYKSMVIHPSLNEVVGWSLGNLKPVNISEHHH